MRFLDWLELHVTAFRLGVSSDWLRDARDRYGALELKWSEPRTLEEKQRRERQECYGLGWTAEELARLDTAHAMELAATPSSAP